MLGVGYLESICQSIDECLLKTQCSEHLVFYRVLQVSHKSCVPLRPQFLTESSCLESFADPSRAHRRAFLLRIVLPHPFTCQGMFKLGLRIHAPTSQTCLSSARFRLLIKEPKFRAAFVLKLRHFSL